VQIGPATSYFPSLTAMRQSTPSPTASSPATGSGFEAALAAVTPQPTTMSDAQRYAPQDGNLLSYLTPADRQLLQAVTGFEVSSDGQVVNPDYSKSVDDLIVEVANARYYGELTGEVTGDYLKGMFAKYAGSENMAASFSPERLQKALDLLADRDARRAQGVRPSSFNVSA
jgi:hypothetical protein